MIAGYRDGEFKRLPLDERLSALRERDGISLSKAARKIGITKAHLWDLEQGRSANPTLKTVLAICAVYDITVQMLTAGLKSDR
jgi:transcriptional regulator with XRE-family HTH domain